MPHVRNDCKYPGKDTIIIFSAARLSKISATAKNSGLKFWWAHLDSNQGLHPYQRCALTN